jgi:hypothetical protein
LYLRTDSQSIQNITNYLFCWSPISGVCKAVPFTYYLGNQLSLQKLRFLFVNNQSVTIINIYKWRQEREAYFNNQNLVCSRLERMKNYIISANFAVLTDISVQTAIQITHTFIRINGISFQKA